MDYQQPPFQQAGGMPPGMPGGPGMPGTPLPPAEKEPRKRGRGKNKDAKPGKTPSKRLASRQFVFAAVFALAVGGGVAYTASSGGSTGTWVAVAGGPIATNSVIDDNLITAREVSTEQLQPGAVVGASQGEAVTKAAEALKGVRSQYPITANQQLIPDQFGLVVNLGTPLAQDERLVSFRATVAASVAGSVKPGDRVDVFASAGEVAGPIAMNVPVVSVTVSEDRYNSVADQQAGDKNARPQDLLPGDPVPGTYVVRVKADQVGKLVAADGGGKIYLAYRDPEASDVTVPPTTVKEAICEGGGAGSQACN